MAIDGHLVGNEALPSNPRELGVVAGRRDRAVVEAELEALLMELVDLSAGDDVGVAASALASMLRIRQSRGAFQARLRACRREQSVHLVPTHQVDLGDEGGA